MSQQLPICAAHHLAVMNTCVSGASPLADAPLVPSPAFPPAQGRNYKLWINVTATAGASNVTLGLTAGKCGARPLRLPASGHPQCHGCHACHQALLACMQAVQQHSAASQTSAPGAPADVLMFACSPSPQRCTTPCLPTTAAPERR